MLNTGTYDVTDEELMIVYSNLYKLYVQMQDNRIEHITRNLKKNDLTFRIRNDYLEKAINNYKEMIHKLGLESLLLNGVTKISVQTIISNFGYICAYITKQVIALSMYASIMKGYVDDSNCISGNTYIYSIVNASELGLGFNKYKFMKCESGLLSGNVTAKQIVDVMNTINKALKGLVNKYIAGSEKMGRLSTRPKGKMYLFAGKMKLYSRMCKYYNDHNPIVSFVNNEVGVFKLCK